MTRLYDTLNGFSVDWSGDGPTLQCDTCKDTLCDVEHGDSLSVLAQVADSHLCSGAADEDEVILRFPGFPPVRGVGPVITAVES